MSELEFRAVTASWNIGNKGSFTVFENLDICIESGQFVALMGPNGSGKSTVLRLAAGFLRPSIGAVYWRGGEVTGPSVERGFIPQQPMLLEWLSIRENVAFGPRMLGVSKSERRLIAMELLDRLGLAQWSERYPSELSGGMRARVALAMTLANKPRLICLDESFGPLDFQTRLVAQQALIEVWQQASPSILLVTHRVEDALLADRVLVFGGNPSRIELDRLVVHGDEGRTGDQYSRTLVESKLRSAALAAFKSGAERR